MNIRLIPSVPVAPSYCYVNEWLVLSLAKLSCNYFARSSSIKCIHCVRNLHQGTNGIGSFVSTVFRCLIVGCALVTKIMTHGTIHLYSYPISMVLYIPAVAPLRRWNFNNELWNSCISEAQINIFKHFNHYFLN